MRRALLGAMVFAGALGGCFVVSGGTDGYAQMDAGYSACAATFDCHGGEICCLVVSLSSPSGSGTSCQTPASGGCSGGDFAVQLCATDADCGGKSACIPQQCSVGAVPTTFAACGTIPIACAPLSLGGGDAGSASDSGLASDAGGG